MSSEFRFQRAGFGQGLRWIPAGAELLSRGFRVLVGIAALWFLVSLIQIVPLIGPALLLVFTPLLTAGVLVAFHQVHTGSTPTPATLFAGWVDPRRRLALIVLGMWAIVGTLAAVSIFAGWLAQQLDPAQLEAAMRSPETLAEALQGARVGPGLLGFLLVIGLVLASLYLAVPLVMFGGLAPMAALWLSLKIVLSNLTAFIGLLLTTIGLALAMGLMLAMIALPVSIALGTLGAVIAQALILIAAMLFQMLMAGAQYVAFRQLTGWQPPDSDDQAPSGRDDELLA